MVPGSTTMQAPNRGRAAAVAAQVVNLTTVDLNPDNPIIYGGAGKWSDDRDFGRERLERGADAGQGALHLPACRRRGRRGRLREGPPNTQTPFQQAALKTEASLECLRDGRGRGVHLPQDRHRRVDGDRPLHRPHARHARPDQRCARKRAVACLKYDDTLEGMFRTPGLLNVAKTAPYFHSGAVQTLEEVVPFYNQGGGSEGTFAAGSRPSCVPCC